MTGLQAACICVCARRARAPRATPAFPLLPDEKREHTSLAAGRLARVSKAAAGGQRGKELARLVKYLEAGGSA